MPCYITQCNVSVSNYSVNARLLIQCITVVSNAPTMPQQDKITHLYSHMLVHSTTFPTSQHFVALQGTRLLSNISQYIAILSNMPCLLYIYIYTKCIERGHDVGLAINTA